MIAELIVIVLLPALLALAACWDIASFTIPNFIQAALIVIFIALVFVLGMTPVAFGMHLLAGFLGLVVGFSLFALGFVGGGDAKLFACVCLTFGIQDLLGYALMASVLGGVLCIVLIAGRKLPLPRVLAETGWISRLHDERQGIPYGVALAAGAFVILPHTEIFRSALGL